MGSRIASYHLTSLKSLQNHCAGPCSLYSQVGIFIPITWACWSFSVSRAKNSNPVAPCNRWFHFKLFQIVLKFTMDPPHPGTTKTSKWRAYFLFRKSVRKFWSTSQEIPFSRENFRSEDKINLAIYIPSEIIGHWTIGSFQSLLASQLLKLTAHITTFTSLPRG